MISTTTDIVLTVLFLLGMALFGLAMLALVLRVGPRRGFWNQPAAELRRPRPRVIGWLYVFAAVHVLLGLYVTFFIEPHQVGVLIVLVLTAGFYVLCGHAYQLAHAVVDRRERRRAR
jgi:hypothetical protein